MRLSPDRYAQGEHISVTSFPDTAVSVTLAANVNEAWVIDQIIWSYSAQNVSGGLTIQFGSDTPVDHDIVVGGMGLLAFRTSDDDGLYSGSGPVKNQSVTITLKAGGTSVVGKLTVRYR